MNKLASYVANVLADGKIIADADKENCSYGIEIMLLSVGEMLIILMISLFAKNFVETVVFFIVFIPLRIYAGGYHANTRLRCFAILVGVYIIFSILLKIENEQIHTILIYCGTIFSMIIVLWLSPVVHSRKHLTEKEILIFRKISLKICFTETIIILLIMIATGQNIYLLSGVYGQLAVTISMVGACIKKHLTKGGVN